jgi:Cu(I)/Ag(I) efflux system membrane protein CusA/SilA
MVVYLREALEKKLATGEPLTPADIRDAAIEGAVHRLRPKLMTIAAVLASLIPILRESGIGADVMKPIAAPIVGGMTTSTIHVLILVPVFFVMMKTRALRPGAIERAPR